MKNFFIFLTTFIVTASSAAAAQWWDKPTVCKISSDKCYTSSAGYDTEIWDASGNNGKGCWGMKYICAEALQQESNESVLVGKKDITDKNINPDFDVNKLSDSGDCFGRRTTNENGNEVKVNGEYVKVWCNGVLNKSDETLANGDIVYGTQPTCNSLKQNGYIAVENGKCFGKYYDETDYHIECGDKVQPKRIIVLNGAEYKKHNYSGPITVADAEELFDTMFYTSKSQKNKYFKK